MTGFVSVAVVLAVAALGFVLWPLLGRVSRGQAGLDAGSRTGENVTAYRQRLAELEAEHGAGRLDREAFEALKVELDAALLADEREPGTEPAAPAHGRRARGAIVVVAVVVPLLALTGYMQLGAWSDVTLREQARILASDEEDVDAELHTLIARLRAHLRDNPGDVENLYLLGHAQMRLGDYEAAVEAFERLAARTRGDVNVLLSLIQADYLADQGRIDADNRERMQRVLAQNPHQSMVLEMLATDAFGRRHFETAAGYLEQALAADVPPEQAKMYREGLARARALAGTEHDRSAETGLDDGATANGADGVAVRVTLALADAVEVTPESRVFVIAREVGGPAIPIAVRALAPSELPAQITLTDADAMQPTRRLSQFEQVELVARLSRTGNAIAQPGDPEVRAGPLEPGAEGTIELIIAP